MSRRALTGALAIAASVLLAGCGGNSTPAAKTPTTTAVAGLPSEAKLKTALLTEKDLPAGWTEIDAGSAATDLCGAPPLASPKVQKVRAAFASAVDSGGEVLQHGVTAYPLGEAARVIAKLAERVKGCTSYRVEVTDPRTARPATFTVAVAPITVPDIGDEHVAISLTIVERGDVTLYAAMRRGDQIGVLALTGRAPTSKAFSDLLGTADRRLAQLAS